MLDTTWKMSKLSKKVNFLVKFQGINPNGSDFLHEPDLLRTATRRGLVAFCWGKVNNEKSSVRQLKEMGVHGVICDR